MIGTDKLTLRLEPSGKVVGLQMGENAVGRDIAFRTELKDCEEVGPVSVRPVEGGVEVVREMKNVDGLRSRLTERFTATEDGVCWEIEVQGEGPFWSTAIIPTIHYPGGDERRFWTACSDAEARNDRWRDPLVMHPFRAVRWSNIETRGRDGQGLIIPLATMAEPALDFGFSVVQSLEDDILDLNLAISPEGLVRFEHLNHRLGGGRTVRFTFDIVPHEADWRGGLRWAVQRYPHFFDPPNPAVHEMAGCGAYSSYQGELDVAKLKQMGFRINWTAAFDFPYLGLGLPPVAPGTTWTSWRGRETSAAHMDAYAATMRADGFHVLSYFTMSEFGSDIRHPRPERKTVDEADLWRHANDFLYERLAGGILYQEEEKVPYPTWDGAVVMDCGDPDYRAFLLDQARRHIEEVPNAAGLCMDRMSLYSLYNAYADDGISWVDGAPARLGVRSWHEIMEHLGPMMHEAGKVIFANVGGGKRIDLMRPIDAFFVERGYWSQPEPNGAAFLSLRKPLLVWTRDGAPVQDRPGYTLFLKPDPDEYLQKHLYLGGYPMAPYPDNDHSIGPDAWAEGYYLEYGPLFDALRGKKWVLEPHCIDVDEDQARSNLFEVPEGWVAPIVFGGDAPEVTVIIQNVPGLTATARYEALYPGEATAKPVSGTCLDGVARLTVPLKRRCALLIITP